MGAMTHGCPGDGVGCSRGTWHGGCCREAAGQAQWAEAKVVVHLAGTHCSVGQDPNKEIIIKILIMIICGDATWHLVYSAS